MTGHTGIMPTRWQAAQHAEMLSKASPDEIRRRAIQQSDANTEAWDALSPAERHRVQNRWRTQ